MAKLKNNPDDTDSINNGITETNINTFNLQVEDSETKTDDVIDIIENTSKANKVEIVKENIAKKVEVNTKKIFSLSHKIRIVRKENKDALWSLRVLHPEQEINPSMLYIGASRTSSFNCFTKEERDFYMPMIINKFPTDPNFLQSVNDYFSSIRVAIPVVGKDLEIGFEYTNLPEKYINNDGSVKYFDIPEKEKYLYGMPLNVNDYFLYRYCLVYRLVANTTEDAFAFPHIKFCLIDERKEIAKKQSVLNVKVQGYQLIGEVINNPERMEYILSVMNANLGFGLNVQAMSLEDKQLKLNELVEGKFIYEFIKTANDRDLEYKYKLEMMLYYPEINLTKIPNTETYYYDNDYLIAEKTSTMLSYLKNPPIDAGLAQKINVLKAKLAERLNRK